MARPARYCSTMVLLAAGLGQLLQRSLQQTGLALAPRARIRLPAVEDWAVFPGKWPSRCPRTQL